MTSIPLHEPRIDEVDEKFVLEALRSHWVSTAGAFVERFEREFAAYVGSRHAICMANGTVALQLIVELVAKRAGLTAPYDVIIPTLTFIATANAVSKAGGIPVLIDASPETFNLDASSLVDFVTSKYRREGTSGVWRSKDTGRSLAAIMPAHLMGWHCNLNALSNSCRELGVTLIEDAAEALGCRDERNMHVGRSGLASAFSFNGNKIVTTGGGGMVVTDDDAFAKAIKHISTTAKTDGLRFVHDEIGYNFRLPNPLAALGCSQLMKLDDRLKRKRAIFEMYSVEFNGSPARIHSEDCAHTNNWIVNIHVPNAAARDHVLEDLLKEQIHARPLWLPIHLQPAYQHLNERLGHFPNAVRAWETTVSLPSSAHLKDDEIRWIAGIVRATLDRVAADD